MSDAPALLRPDWPAPRGVHAAFTLRGGGVSQPPWDSLNVGSHVGDDPVAVAENRRRLRAALALPAEPLWLEQVHGRDVVDADAPAAASGPVPRGDAVVTMRPGRVCAIQVADCLPVLFAATDGSCVGAAHAGWRGLASGVLEATVRALRVAPAGLMAWLGPAIGPAEFEVGDEVREAFLAAATASAGPGSRMAVEPAFVRNAAGRWQADLYELARQRLAALGLHSVWGGGESTYADPGRFYSHRRGAPTGRHVALIWLDSTVRL